MTTASFTLGQEELVLLLWLMRYPSLDGLGPQPLGDATAEQRAVMLATAERSLQARGWLEIIGPNQVKLQEDVEAILRACGDAATTIRYYLRRGLEASLDQRFYYVAERCIVEHVTPQPGLHRFCTLASKDQLTDILVGLTPPVSSSNLGDIAFSLPSSAFARLRGQTPRPRLDETTKYLADQLGVEKTTAEAFAITLTAPLWEIHLGVSKKQGTGTAQEILFLAGTNASWCAQAPLVDGGILNLDVVAVNTSQVDQQMRRWLLAQ